MPIFDEKRYKNSPETESHIMIILRSTPSSTNRHKSGVLERDFSSLIIQYIILDKGSL